MLLAVLTGVPILRTGFAIVPRPPMSTVEWALYTFLMLTTMHVVILVHEVGHVLGGWLAGFRFQFIVVGPIRIERESDGLHMRLNRSIRHYAGVAGSTPGDETALRGGWIAQAAAGPALSLLAGVLVWLAIRRVDGLMWAGSGFAGFSGYRALVLFAAGSLAVGLITGLPGGTADRPTDTSRIIELLQRDTEAPTPASRPASTE